MGYCGTTGCQPFGTASTAGGYVGCQRVMTPAALPCEDIRTTGTRLSVTDDSYTSVTLPFSFNFYGAARTTALISASGLVSFSSNGSTSNACLPTTSYPYPMIMPMWDHLHPSTGGVYAQVFGTAPNRRYVVQWSAQVYPSTTPMVDVRLVMKEGKGDIDMCYVSTLAGGSTYDNGIGATSGIQSGTGLGLQFSCNTATLVSGLLLSYTAP